MPIRHKHLRGGWQRFEFDSEEIFLRSVHIIRYNGHMLSSKVSPSKHIMLSYQWDNQELVLKVYEYLKNQNLSVWMDIQGGMKLNIYEWYDQANQQEKCT